MRKTPWIAGDEILFKEGRKVKENCLDVKKKRNETT